ncbi:GNAT family N-acetyltransferase [uncultured Roseibium sp.]|uniref:GNAT family N-acetyltransferase n=1 Tax=uncultured Roseibium sp. TaxID=1936171 RepID=UPI003217E5AF
MSQGSRIDIALAGPDDVEAIAALFAAIDLHYQNQTLDPEEALEKAALYLREPDNGAHYAIARIDGTPVGLACFALFRHGLIATGSVFLKDLFVTEAARGSGAGEALMQFVARYARDRDVTRIDLSVDVPNTGAARFYDRLGGRLEDSKRFYRFIGEAFAKLADKG